MPRGRRGSYRADQGLIQGARDIAQANTYGNKLISDAYGEFGESFNKNFKILKDNFDKKQKEFNGKMKLIDDQQGDITQLSEDQTNQYTSFFLGKKRDYAEIIRQLEDRTLSFEERSSLKFEANNILASARNSAQQLQSRNTQIATLRDDLINDRFSNSNFFTDPDKAAKAHDYAFKSDFLIDNGGNIDGDLQYNMLATVQAEEFLVMASKLRDQATKYGIEKEDDFYEQAERGYRSRLDDDEVLSFMFDDLSINNGGYFENIISAEPTRKNELIKYRDMLANESTRDEAIRYFKDTVIDELSFGLKNNIDNGLAEYKKKNPKAVIPDNTGDGLTAAERLRKEQKDGISQAVVAAYNKVKDNPYETEREEYEYIALQINKGLNSYDLKKQIKYNEDSGKFDLKFIDSEKEIDDITGIDPNDVDGIVKMLAGMTAGIKDNIEYQPGDYGITISGEKMNKVTIKGVTYTKKEVLDGIKKGKLIKLGPIVTPEVPIAIGSALYNELLQSDFISEIDLNFNLTQ